jgi:hypothetical protein
MRIKIKEPKPYDGTHNAKLLETFVGTLSSTWSS